MIVVVISDPLRLSAHTSVSSAVFGLKRNCQPPRKAEVFAEVRRVISLKEVRNGTSKSQSGVLLNYQVTNIRPGVANTW